MGRSRRTLDRRTLRDEADAAERQKQEGAAGAEEAADDDGGDDDDSPKKKAAKKKAPAKPRAKAPAKPRTRTAKVVRMRVVWGIFSNSNQLIEEFDYPQKAEAEEKLAKLQVEKKTGSPFFLQPVKKPMDKEVK